MLRDELPLSGPPGPLSGVGQLVGAQMPVLHIPHHLVWVLEAIIRRAPQLGVTCSHFLLWMPALFQTPDGSSIGLQLLATGAHAHYFSAGGRWAPPYRVKESGLYLHLACSGSCWQPRLAFHCRCCCTRFSRTPFCPQEQYGLCYELALSYLNSFETYGNFK